jgi:hypothetical protein
MVPHTNFFGTLAYGNQQAENDYDTTPLEETLLALQEEKVRLSRLYGF